jgi:lysophospholipase L1-like esterase
VGCFYAKSAKLPKVFAPTGSDPSLGIPIYLTGCKPLTITGNLFGLGDSTMYGEGVPEPSLRFVDLFGSWLNANYGPVTVYNKALPGFTMDQMFDFCSRVFEGKTVNICVLEVGMTNFNYKGSPERPFCGGESLLDGYSSALHYGDDLTNIILKIKSQMAPKGVLMVTNLYECDDHYDVVFPGWKDYHAILAAYNDVTAMVAKASGAKLIDVYSLLASNPSLRDSFNNHPNHAGHVAIAELLKTSMEK